MMGAGILPGPFSRADETGLDTVLESLERAAAEWGEAYEPPTVLRRLVAQGRLGKKAGQGFFPYPQPDAGDQRETVLLETRGDMGIAWLNRPPANPLSPQAVKDLISLWEEVEGKLRALVFASSNIFTFSAGADIKEFTKMTPEAEGRELVESAHALHARDGVVVHRHDRGGQLDRLRRRLRAGDGMRLPDRRRVGHLRPAGDQPRDHPRVRRHPAAAAAGGRVEGTGDEPRGRSDRRLRGAPGRTREPGGARPRAARHGPAPGLRSSRARRRSP